MQKREQMIMRDTLREKNREVHCMHQDAEEKEVSNE